MKCQAILSIVFSACAVNALAATSGQPVIAEGGSKRRIEAVWLKVALTACMRNALVLLMVRIVCKTTKWLPMAPIVARQHRCQNHSLPRKSPA
jgi:hypothetical protein